MNKLAALFAISLAAACAADPSMDPGDPGIDPSGDTTAPTVSSISPADGASGIHRDSAVVISFTEAMDQLSVQNSLESADLGAVSFEWNDEGRTLRIVPANPLEYADGTGIDPSVTPALVYDVVLGTGATDVAGNPLESEARTSFATLKRIAHTLVRNNPQTVSGTPDSVTSDSDDFLVIGDDDNGELASAYRSYITMDLSPLPESALLIESATLHSNQIFVAGNPYTELGNGSGLLLDHGIFVLSKGGQIIFDLASVSEIGEFAQADDVFLSIDVSEAANDDLQNRAEQKQRSQYRLRFDAGTNLDDVADSAYIGRDELAMDVVYITP